MAENLESRIRSARVELGNCLRVVYDLSEPVLENLRLYGKEIHKLQGGATHPVWDHKDVSKLLKATQLLRACADLVKKDLKAIWKSDEVKELPIVEGRMFDAIGALNVAEEDLAILLKNQDLWVAEKDTRGAVEFFWAHFGSKGHAWAGAMVAWSMLFYITADIPTTQVKLSEAQSRAWYDAWTDNASYQIKMRIIEEVDRKAEREIVEVINSDNEVVYFTGPSSLTMFVTFTAPGKAHGSPEWQYKPKGRAAGKTLGLSRQLTADEKKYVTEQILPKVPHANLLYITQAIGKSDLYVVEVKSEKEVLAFDEPEWNLISGGIVTYKGKTFARALQKDELKYVKAVLKEDPGATIEEVASGLMLNVVKLPSSSQKKEEFKGLTPNASEIGLKKKLWRA